jgi:hypothetical protein
MMVINGWLNPDRCSAFFLTLFCALTISCAAAEAPGQPIDSRIITGDGSTIQRDRGDITNGDGPPVTSKAIYVSTTGQDTPDCGDSPTNACKSVKRGVVRARASNPPLPVKVAGGTYFESVTLADQVSVFGGYSQDFDQGPGFEKTIIQGGLIGGEAIAVKAENITRETQLAYLTIRSANAEQAGGSSYGIWLGDCPRLRMHHLTIIVGYGSDGQKGAPSKTGAIGKPGDKGFDGDFAFPFLACGTVQPGAPGYFGAGGVSDCNKNGGNGGRGDLVSIVGGTLRWGRWPALERCERSDSNLHRSNSRSCRQRRLSWQRGRLPDNPSGEKTSQGRYARLPWD